MSLTDWLNPVTNPILNPGAALLNNSPVKPGAPAASSPFGVTTVGSPFGNFTHWLPYMVLMGGVLLMVSQSPKYAPLGVAFAGVIAGGYFLINYNGVTKGFNETFTTTLPSA